MKPKLKDCGEETLFPLQYSSEHSGANIVKGTVGLRFMYHTRGSVLRGLDEASLSPEFSVSYLPAHPHELVS